jgi:hypothetical protein
VIEADEEAAKVKGLQNHSAAATGNRNSGNRNYSTFARNSGKREYHTIAYRGTYQPTKKVVAPTGHFVRGF